MRTEDSIRVNEFELMHLVMMSLRGVTFGGIGSKVDPEQWDLIINVIANNWGQELACTVDSWAEVKNAYNDATGVAYKVVGYTPKMSSHCQLDLMFFEMVTGAYPG
jgi:hypothetical protein